MGVNSHTFSHKLEQAGSVWSELRSIILARKEKILFMEIRVKCKKGKKLKKKIIKKKLCFQSYFVVFLIF